MRNQTLTSPAGAISGDGLARFVSEPASARPLAVFYRPVPACLLLAAAALGLWVALRDGLDLSHSPQDYWLGYGLFVASRSSDVVVERYAQILAAEIDGGAVDFGREAGIA